MAKINQQVPQDPWPWGPPAHVRERLVEPAQVDRKKKVTKKSNPKDPPLASVELLDFIGPAHTSDELRLPPPPLPPGHGADLKGFADRPYLGSIMHRASPERQAALQQSLGRVQVTSERMDRIQALLGREAQMLELLGRINEDVNEIHRKREEEQAGEGV